MVSAYAIPTVETEEMKMVILKKVIKILAILMASLVLLILSLILPTKPSKAKLCQDVESYLPKAECIRQENALEIVKQAFPKGEVSSSDVKSALGEYLHAEYSTTYGHLEEYYISIRPINYLFRDFEYLLKN